MERCLACGAVLAGELFFGVLQIEGAHRFCRLCTRDLLDRLDHADAESIDVLEEAWRLR